MAKVGDLTLQDAGERTQRHAKSIIERLERKLRIITLLTTAGEVTLKMALQTFQTATCLMSDFKG